MEVFMTYFHGSLIIKRYSKKCGFW